MDMDIITISDGIDRLSYRLKTTFKGFGGKYYSDYGDEWRVPEEYIRTDTLKKFFIGTIESNPFNHSKNFYKDFPKLSQILLKNLFAEIGVKYVPEILLYQQKETNKNPYELFRKFCITFSPKASRVEAREVNRVVLKLKEIDEYRVKYPFNSKPLYFQLSLGNFRQVDNLIFIIKETILLLDNLEAMDSEIFDEAKEEFIRYWDSRYAINSFKQKHNLD